MSSEIGYEPTGNLTLSDGKNHITLPQWTQWVLADIFEHETEPLQAENAKLRELVRDMWHDARLLGPLRLIGGMRLTDLRKAEYESRMRELGVEVDA